ncbi:hypothetical protein LCGC14_0400730 [marine sediment metagenome]|uniref:Uncharacterized protein n=1 Tax=marine sediment metagenome TaxID=412755 RepID=A0A0F9TF68_9ZZZZ
MTKKQKEENQSGEQLDLIDVAPENAKAIIRAARLYKELQATRITALNKEITQKAEVLQLVKAAKLQPLEGGKIKFEYDNVVVSITPRDELVKVSTRQTQRNKQRPN